MMQQMVEEGPIGRTDYEVLDDDYGGLLTEGLESQPHKPFRYTPLPKLIMKSSDVQTSNRTYMTGNNPFSAATNRSTAMSRHPNPVMSMKLSLKENPGDYNSTTFVTMEADPTDINSPKMVSRRLPLPSGGVR